MLSRLISGPDADIDPIVWRARGAVAGEPKASAVRRPDPPPQSPVEVRDEEKDAAIQRQIRQAFEAGRKEGEAAATRQAEAETRKAVERLAATLADVAATRGEAIRRAEGDIVRLSVEIARRILHRELSVDPSALEALIHAALDKLSGQEVYRVRVHPDLDQTVRTCLKRIGRTPEIEVVSDPSQARGGAVFEMSRGSLDASVETQLREIERGLADHIGERA